MFLYIFRRDFKDRNDLVFGLFVELVFGVVIVLNRRLLYLVSFKYGRRRKVYVWVLSRC